MAMATVSGNAFSGSGAFAQIQQLQAQRRAEQAEQHARALREKASEAQTVADRAQENARSLKVESEQAQGEASQAQRGLAGLGAGQEVQKGLANLRQQIGQVLQSGPLNGTSPAPAPVVNALGQETGTVVNVTA